MVSGIFSGIEGCVHLTIRFNNEQPTKERAKQKPFFPIPLITLSPLLGLFFLGALKLWEWFPLHLCNGGINLFFFPREPLGGPHRVFGKGGALSSGSLFSGRFFGGSAL